MIKGTHVQETDWHHRFKKSFTIEFISELSELLVDNGFRTVTLYKKQSIGVQKD